jgi:small subunit ribosomal protein S5
MPPNRTTNPRKSPRPQEEKAFDERVVYINRVARVVKGGRRFRFQALVIVGDHKGQVGVGISKGADVTTAVNKATEVAKKRLVRVPLYRGTLTHEVKAKVGGANILILPAGPGTGLIAGGVVRTVLEVVGIENALSKSLGSTNRVNTAYATLKALQGMAAADKWVSGPKQNHPKITEQTKTADK